MGDVLDQEFPQIRAKALEIAAALDRLDRAAGTADGDRRVDQLRQVLEILLTDRADRARQVQLLLSREYRPSWRTDLDLSGETGSRTA